VSDVLATDAREDWQRRIYRRTDTGGRTAGADIVLPAPEGLTAVAGRGLVSLSWTPVPDAGGYLISRATSPQGPWSVLEHGNSDVRAVPDPWYADGRVETGTTYHYRVASTVAPDLPAGPTTDPVAATPIFAPGESDVDATGRIDVTVDATRVVAPLNRVWHMVGSERLSQLWLDRDGAANPVGQEFRDALAMAHQELGVRRVRAHAIYHDDVAVLRWPEGCTPEYDFTGVDRIVDELRAVGVRPVLELGFLPKDLAADPTKTTFQYRGYISLPKDWAVWAELNRRLAAHLVERYGIEEVAGWGFEVWNEPNLEVFWTGTKNDYLRLYAEAAYAVKSVDERLLVGGPATAASEWVEDLCAFCADTGTPLDFVSTHTYGNAPVAVRQILRRHGFEAAQVWWTEWGVGHTHFAPIHDTAYGAPFVLRGFKSAQERVDALAYWVVSDHFEELGRPPRLLHGGFGLLTVGNLRKPRWWAVAFAEGLGDDVVASTVHGDGAAGGLVEAWAARDSTGRLDVLVWNAAPDATLFRGVSILDRTVSVAVSGLPVGRYAVRIARVDNSHSSIAQHVDDDLIWPDEAGWARLRAANVLDEESLPHLAVESDGERTSAISFDVPMPGVVRLRFTPLLD
jgi:xylan 1,4-beta-xylosidase